MDTQTSSTIQAISSIFEAVGTVGAVIVALFLQIYRVWRRKPSLSLTFDPSASDDDIALVDWDDYLMALRVKVHNAKGKATSLGTQVVLERVVMPPQEKGNSIQSRNMAWSDDVPGDTVSIPSGTWRRADICLIIVNRPDEDSYIFTPGLKRYDTTWPPSRRWRLTASGRYSFQLMVSGDNCDATRWSISFDHHRPNEVSEISQLRSIIRNVEIERLDQASRASTTH